MSKTIDERVVSLQFDNKNFEKNAKESMSTLEKLKEKLSFKGASKGLEEVNDAAKNVNMSGLENNVGKVGLKFNWLHSVAHSALDRITNKVMDTGQRLLSSLTIDPVKTGLSEYETQLNSVQTILANTESKGSTLKDVNRALDELNEYADKTIYNFTEMTRNIGTFTAAGVDLDTSVQSIKGIANLAAVSGSTSQQASTAMYQLSQALASGTVKLMDWNSVVNAGMGGEVFQDALKETARVHGVAIDDIIKSQGSFRESLSEGWLTADILNETLEKFTMTTEGLSEAEIEANRVKLRNIGYTEEQIDKIFKLGNTATAAATKVKTASQMIDVMKESAQSGWAQSWKIIIGDFEEAKELWTMASDAFTKVIGDSAEKRNKLLKDTLSSGWDKWMEKGIMDEEGYEFHLKEVIKQNEKITQGLKDAGLADSFAELIEFNGGSLTKALRQGFQAGVIPAETLSESVARLTDAYSKCSDEELEAAGYTRVQYENMVKLNEQFQNGEISAEDFAKAITKLSGRELIFDKDLGILPNIFKSIYEMIKPIGNAWKAIFPSDGRAEKIYNLLAKIQEKVLEFKDSVIENGDKIFRTFRGLFSIVGMVWHVFKLLFRAIGKVTGAFKGVGGSVLTATATLGDFLYNIYKIVTGSGKLEDAFDAVGNAIAAVITGFRNFWKNASGEIDISPFTGFVEVLKKVWTFIKNVFSTILTAIAGIGNSVADTIDGTGISGILDLINAGLITAIIVKLKNLFSGFDSILEGFTEIMDQVAGTFQSFNQRVKAESLKAVAVAIAILAGSILVLSLINKDKLETALAAITMLFIELTVLTSVMGKVSGALRGGGTILAIGASLLLMAFALKKVSNIPWQNMLTSIGAMTAVMFAMVGALAVMSRIKGGRKGFNEGAGKLLQLALVMWVVSIPLKKLSKIEWTNLTAAVGAMGVTLASMLAILYATSKFKPGDINAIKIIVITTSLSTAMIPLSFAMKKIAQISWDGIGKSITVMGTVLVGMIAIMALMSKLANAASGGTKVKLNIKKSFNVLQNAFSNSIKLIGTGVQFMLIATAMIEIAAALTILSQIPWKKMKVGLTAMAGIFTVLFILMKMLSTLTSYTENIDTKNTKTLYKYLHEQTSLLKNASALLVLVAVIKLLSNSLIILGQLKWETMFKGLTSMALMLGLLTSVLKRLSKINTSSLSFDGKNTKTLFGFIGEQKDLIKNAATLLILVGVIKTLSSSLLIIGQMKWGTIIKGLISMSLMMSVLTKVLKKLSKISTTSSTITSSNQNGIFNFLGADTSLLKNAAALLILAASLNVMTGALVLMGNLRWGTIIKGLIGMAGVLLVLGVAAKFLSATGAGFMAFSVGALSLGAACLIAGAGIFLLAKGLQLIAKSLGDALNVVCQVIIEAAPLIGQAITAIIVSILRNLVVVVDEVIGSLAQIIINSMRSMADYIPEMADAFMDLLVGVVDKLIEFIPDIVKLVGKLLSKLFSAIFEELANVDTTIFVKILIGISAMVLIMKELAKLKKDALNAMIGAAALVGTFTVLIGLFGLLAQIPGSKDFATDAVELIKIIGSPDSVLSIGLLAGLMMAIMAISKKLKLTNKSSTKNILVIATNLAIFIGGLIVLFTAIGTICLLSGYIGVIENAAEVIKIIGSPLVITSLGMLAALMISIQKVASVLKVTGKTATKNLIKMGIDLVAFIGALLVLFTAIGLLTLIDGYTELIRSAAGILRIIAGPEMIFCLTALAALSILFSKVKINVTNVALGGAGIAVIIGEIMAICLALGLLTSIPGLMDKTIAGIEVIKLLGSPTVILAFGLLTVLSLALGAFSFIAAGAIAGGAMFAAVIAELVVVCLALGALAMIPDVMNLVQGGINIIKLLGAPDTIVAFGLIAVFVGVVGLLAPLIAAAVAGLTGLAGVIIILTGVMTALGALYSIPGITELISGGGKMLEAIGNAIGSFFGGIVAGVADAATAGLPELGRRFSEFMTNLQPFLYGIKSVTPETAQAAKDLASALLVLTAGNLVDQLTNWLFGDQDLGKFGEDLAAFGKGVKKFNDEVTDIKPETIKAGAEAGKLLAEMASEMPRQDGWWQKIFGGKDLESFGNTLQTFGKGVRLFGEEVKTVDPETITKGAEAGTQLAEMTNELSRTGGKWQEFWGEEDLGLFSTNITEFGKAIAGFGSNVSNVGADTIKAAAEAAVNLVSAANDFGITDDSPIMTTDMETFRTKLSVLYVAIDSFVTNMGSVSTTTIESIKGKMNTLTTTIQSLSKNGVEAMTSTFKNSTNDITGAVSGAIQSAISTVKSFGMRLFTAGKEIVKNFVDGITSTKDASTKAIMDIYNATFSAIDDAANRDDFYTTGAYLIQGFANGISQSSYLAEQSAASAAKAAKEAIDNALGIESPSKELYKSGEYTIEGYTNALDDGTGDINKAGQSLGNKVLAAIGKYVLKIQQMLDDGIEINPVIRPTLDLSYVEGGMNRLNGMFSDSGYMARINATSAQMSKNQNGSDNDDIIDAIGELGDRIENAQGDRINVGNININDSDEDVAEAIEILIRKALLERRR